MKLFYAAISLTLVQFMPEFKQSWYTFGITVEDGISRTSEGLQEKLLNGSMVSELKNAVEASNDNCTAWPISGAVSNISIKSSLIKNTNWISKFHRWDWSISSTWYISINKVVVYPIFWSPFSWIHMSNKKQRQGKAENQRILGTSSTCMPEEWFGLPCFLNALSCKNCTVSLGYSLSQKHGQVLPQQLRKWRWLFRHERNIQTENIPYGGKVKFI